MVPDAGAAAYAVAGAAAASEAAASEAAVADAAEVAGATYKVSVPNALMPLKMASSSICVYQVNTSGPQPFLLFLLHKQENELSFPSLTILGGGGEKKIKYAAISAMQSLFYEASFAYNGFAYNGFAYNGPVIILSANGIRTDAPTDYVWATPFEIMNKGKVMNIAVQPSVIYFFRNNSSFLSLKRPDNSMYETPMIGYYQTDDQEGAHIDELDIYRKTVLPHLGKCYYLEIDLPVKNALHSILRIAFFAGKMILTEELEHQHQQTHDSLICQSKRSYILHDYKQHIVLSLQTFTR